MKQALFLLCLLVFRAESLSGSPNRVFTTTVDWYKPPPKAFDYSGEKALPSHLFARIPVQDESTWDLSDKGITSITTQQLAKFGITINADEVIRCQREKVTEKLHFFEEHHPVDTVLVKLVGKREFKKMQDRHLSIIRELRLEIAWLSQLEGHTRPYLLRAVALSAAGGYFDGTLVGEDLIISHNTIGSQPLPMERCALVAFLPVEPRHVYTCFLRMK